MAEDDMKQWLKKHRAKERRIARSLRGRALLTIDHLLTNIESDDPFLCKLYSIAHCATGLCDNPHEDWVKELNQTYKELKDGG